MKEIPITVKVSLIKAACFGIFGMNDHRIIFEGGDQ